VYRIWFCGAIVVSLRRAGSRHPEDPNRHDSVLSSGTLQLLRDVKVKSVVPTFMCSYRCSVNKLLALPVDRPEVKQHIFATERRGERKGPSIPQLVVFADSFAHTGKCGFDGKGYQDFPLVG